MNDYVASGAKDMGAVISVLEILPSSAVREIKRIANLRRDFPNGLSEVRIRVRSPSSLVISGENIRLCSRISETQMRAIYDRALGGALYAHIDEIKRGFISMRGGIRVGISASRRESGLLPLEVTSLVFRLPSAPSESADAVFSLWQSERPRGTLVFSSPGGGKTSLLRALAGKISRDCAMRVAVIDERREFLAEDYYGSMVDLLSGYEKAEGVEIAMRTLSPELIVIDEIGSEREADSLLSVGRGGVPVIASAHAESFGELMRKASVSKLCENGFFELFIRLSRDKNKFSFDCIRASELQTEDAGYYGFLDKNFRG